MTSLLVMLLTVTHLLAESEVLELSPFVVEGSHQLGETGLQGFLVSEWTQEDVLQSRPLTLDDVLQLDPTFSFYRRQTASFANPSTQGVSLRNIGATAGSRSLVVLDGLPMNDPFGGWVSWARFPSLGLESVSIQPASKASSWGQMSAGGVVRIQRSAIDVKRLETATFVGQAETFSSEWLYEQSIGHQAVSLGARTFQSQGGYVVHPEDRGVIDQTSEMRHEMLNVRWETDLSEGGQLQLNASYFNEARNNGTPQAVNSTLAKDFSLRYSNTLERGGYSVSVFQQQREFENTFTSVSSDRSSENPVNHQFSIPGEALGFKAIGFSELRPGWALLTGVDGLRTVGETNEDTGWGLVNRRKAGGRQQLLGVFVSNQFSWADEQMLDVNVRLDYWKLWDGFRTELDKRTDLMSKDERYEDRSAWEPALSISYQRKLSERLQWNLGLARSFRLPTINELYRPFRVRNDITEANPQLVPEHFTNLESSLRWRVNEAWTVELGLFEYWIEDMVANVYQFDGPAPSIGGFVPAGGTFSQKQNVEDSRVSGAELKLNYAPSDTVSLGFHYFYSDARFLENPLSPGIEDRDFPQIPLHKLVLQGSWEPFANLRLDGWYTFSAAQYDDALNTRELDSYSKVDVAASYRLDLEQEWTVYIKVSNLTNEVILTGKASNGVRSIAPERMIRVGANWKFW